MHSLPAAYAQEKEFSAQFDAELGFSFTPEETEGEAESLSSALPHQTWKHLSPQVFQTPYPELLRIIDDADPDESLQTWVDLGCGYGRFGLMLSLIRPSANFIGIECVKGRVGEGRRVYRRHGLDPMALRIGDCERDPLPSGDAYFIYDFGSSEAISATLEKLRLRAMKRPVTLIGRGRAVRDRIERSHPWLSVVPPLHRPHYSIYLSKSGRV